MDNEHVDPGQFLFGMIMGTLSSVIISAASATARRSTAARRWTMSARDERGKGIPLSDIQRVARHYNLSYKDAEELLSNFTVDELLPPRGSGLPSNFELAGQTADELKRAMEMAESSGRSGSVEVAIVSSHLPTEDELAEFYVKAEVLGCPISYPKTSVTDGLPVTSFKFKVAPTAEGETGFAWAALFAIIPTALIVGLITFGIVKIEDVSKALVPLLLITFGGLIVITAIVTRKPVVEAAGKYAQSRYAKTQLKYHPKTETAPRTRIDHCREAREAMEKYQADVQAGHTEAAQYWKGQGEVHAMICAEQMPQTRKRYTREMVGVEVWEERDRLHIMIRGKEDQEPVAEWWDDEARQMFEDGFFKRGRQLPESVLEYAESVGILSTESLKSVMESQYLTVTDPGDTTFKKGETVSLASFTQENKRVSDLGKKQASGTYEIKGHKPGNGNGTNLLDYLGDSPEFLAYTIDMTGWRQQLENNFQAAIARARS